MFTGLLDAAMRHCRTPEERLFFQQTIIDRIVAYPNFVKTTSPNSCRKAHRRMSGALEIRGKYTPVPGKRIPPILKELPCRVAEFR